MKDNPLDRIRTNSSRSFESAEDCYSIVVYGRDGVQTVLPYSYLRGAAARYQSCVLLHSLAVVTIEGDEEDIREVARLLSRQRLAAVRHGIDDLRVTVQFENDIDVNDFRVHSAMRRSKILADYNSV